MVLDAMTGELFLRERNAPHLPGLPKRHWVYRNGTGFTEATLEQGVSSTKNAVRNRSVHVLRIFREMCGEFVLVGTL